MLNDANNSFSNSFRRQDEGHVKRIIRRHRRGDIAGTNGNDGYTTAVHFHSQAFQVTDGSSFGSGVGATPGETAIAGNTGDTDQAALSGRSHWYSKRLEKVDHADDIGGKDVLKNLAIFGVFGEGAPAGASIGNNDIGSAMAAHKILRGRLDGGSIADISDIEGCAG